MDFHNATKLGLRLHGAAGVLAIATLVLVGCAGCGDSGGDGGGNGTDNGSTNGGSNGGDFALGENADIKLDPELMERPVIDSFLAPGETQLLTTDVLNGGVDPLEISSIELVYQPPAGASDSDGPAFELVFTPELPAIVHPADSGEFPTSVQIRVRYTKQADDTQRTAQLVIESSDSQDPTTTVEFYTETGQPNLLTSPSTVDFGLVPDGETYEEELKLTNTGTRTLLVSGFKINKDGRFGVKGDEFEIGGNPGNPLKVDLPSAIAVGVGETWPVTVTFTSDSPSPSEGELVIFSDDPDSGSSGEIVPLVANKSGPCILVEPVEINFGGKVVGTPTTINFEIFSCGTQPLSVSGLALTPSSSLDYTMDLSGLPEPIDPEVGPTATTPLVIPVNETVAIPVTYIPDEVNPKDAENVAIPDLGQVQILSDAFASEVLVDLIGAGAEEECPTPVIYVEEGDEVIPQTVLHLDGTQSYAPFGAVVKYLWTVVGPEGDAGSFVPTPSDSNPIYEANVVGLYEFSLEVWDEDNNKSCSPAVYQVLVQPDQAIHVELTWTTPLDLDETDEGEGVGTDLDLHFTHPNATGPDLDKDGEPEPWFDQEWDCFWYNSNPDWGSFDPNTDDNPSLDRDDTDGAGPENLNLGIPEDGAHYDIGVHYWDDHGFEDVLATVKVFTYATEIYNRTDVPLTERDMWCVGDVNWPDPVVTPCGTDGVEKIVPDYVNPFFFTPF